MISPSSTTPRLEVYLKKYVFRPKWSFVVATILCVALFINLGFWQLGRAKQKTLLQTQYAARMHVAAMNLPQVHLPPRALHFYPVKMKGHYDNAHTFLLDNKIQAHKIGYEVITPFQVENYLTVLVNRGWVPAETDREHLPVLATLPKMQVLEGYVYVPPGKPFTLGDPYAVTTPQHWPLRVEALEVAMAAKILNVPLYPYLILLNPSAPTGFVRNWQPVNLSPERHIGYAVQWFTFAAVLIIIFFILNIRKR